MTTPAGAGAGAASLKNKKRRVEAASAALRKPFRSPLLSRRRASAPAGGAGLDLGGEGDGDGDGAARSGARGNSRPSTPLKHAERPSSPAASASVDVGVSGGVVSPERVHKRPGAGAGVKTTTMSTGRKLVEARRNVEEGEVSPSARRRGGVHAVTTPTPPVAPAAAHGVATAGASVGGGKLSTLISEFEREAGEILDDGGDGDEEEEEGGRWDNSTLRGRTEDSGDTTEGDTTHRDENAELRRLITKWRAASRLAAEEVFGFVRERVAREGGMKAWRQMQRRQREFFAGMDSDLPPSGTRRPPLGSSQDGDGEGEGEYADEARRRRDDDEEEEEDFTMQTMLASLNVEPDLLGYDPVEDRWAD